MGFPGVGQHGVGVTHLPASINGRLNERRVFIGGATTSVGIVIVEIGESTQIGDGTVSIEGIPVDLSQVSIVNVTDVRGYRGRGETVGGLGL